MTLNKDTAVGSPARAAACVSSMTGFARAAVEVSGQLSYGMTLKSVNHRFLDLHLRLPAGCDALEMELRRVLKENLLRGHVELTAGGRADGSCARWVQP